MEKDDGYGDARLICMDTSSTKRLRQERQFYYPFCTLLQTWSSVFALFSIDVVHRQMARLCMVQTQGYVIVDLELCACTLFPIDAMHRRQDCAWSGSKDTLIVDLGIRVCTIVLLAYQ